MKKRLGSIVIVVLFVVGGCLILLDPIQSFLIKRMNDDLLQASAEVMKNNAAIDAAEVSFDFNDVATLSIEDVLKAQFNRDDLYALGSIVVPSVKLRLPIVKGVSNYALAVGAGTMKPDQIMGQGNYALAGHYFKDRNDLLFSPLYGAEIGDSVYITNKIAVYEYKISSKKVIAATDIHIIDDVRDETYLTLITCANDGVERLAIQAQFVKEHSFEDLQDELFE